MADRGDRKCSGGRGRAESDTVELLRLSTEDWQQLVHSGIMGADIAEGVLSGLMQRETANMVALADARTEERLIKLNC